MKFESFLASIVKQISYKPGYRFSFVRESTDCYKITMTARVPDSDNPEQIIEVGTSCSVLESFGKITTVEYIKAMIRTFEYHEMEEWLRINGDRVYTPHRSK